MRRDELRELHCIMPIENMASVMELGILSHVRAKAVPHVAVAKTEIQERRARVRVPGGRPLHEYANLYFTARNPMMYLRQEMHEDLCVISVATDVLDIPGTVVTDRNAATDFVRFEPAPDGIAIVDRALTFATYWTDPNPIAGLRKKQAKQAEVLVPDRVAPGYVKGVYASCGAAGERLAAVAPSCECRLRPSLFFR